MLAAFLYAIYAIFLTWPLATNPQGLLSGPPAFGDLAGGAAQVGYVLQHHIFPFAPAVFHGINAPQGIHQAWVYNWVSFPSSAVIFGLGYLFGATAGSAILLWLSFVVSGLSMFLLTRRLFGSPAAALLAGFAFAFYPFAVAQIGGHDLYMDGFVLVLAVWRMLELIQRPTARNGLLAGLATAFAMWWTPYFILIGGIGFATMAALALVVGTLNGQRGAVVRALMLATLPVVGLLGGLGALAALAGGGGATGIRTQDVAQLYTYSARGLEWLLPDRNNLIFGDLTGGYLASHLHGSNFPESSLYLGLSVILLALAGAARAVSALRVSGREALRRLPVVAAISGLLLALVAMVFSAPPTVGLFGLPMVMPSGVIFKITSTWRVYSRFVELIELGLCLALAFAVSGLLRRRLVSPAVLCVSLGLVLVLDLWARPPVRTTNVAPPPEYVWLAHHPGGIVADYPLQPGDYPHYAPLVWQLDDHHPLFQGYGAGTESETIKLGLADLAAPTTAPGLAAFGVRYIVVHPGQPGGGPDRLLHQGYGLRFSSSQGSVWEVRALPAPTRVDGLENFAPPIGTPGTESRWMYGVGRLGLSARNCSPCRGVLRFTSASYKVARTLTIRDALSGAVLARHAIPAGRSVNIELAGIRLRHGKAQLLLSTNLPATYPNWRTEDPASISVRQPSLTIGRS